MFPAHSDQSGLGLYIACATAKAHGGRIRATSNQNKTTFTLHTPLRPI
ncbi:ATP-binding protein [Roseobacter sp. GAI101]